MTDGLKPLRNMQLTELHCSCINTSDLSPLKDMPLHDLSCAGNHITDISPLQLMPIQSLDISHNTISNIKALQGMPLTILSCQNNQIADLTPLHKGCLNKINCQCNRITSLKPLKSVPLRTIVCAANAFDTIDSIPARALDSFIFSSAALPTAELLRLRDLWRNNRNLHPYAQSIQTLLALREKNVDELRTLSCSFSGYDYLFIPTLLSWKEAEQCAQEMGGHLAYIGHKSINTFIAGLTYARHFWIGLTTTENGHEWSSGDSFTYNGFYDELQEQLPGSTVFNDKWHKDNFPDSLNSFIIQWASP